MGGFPVSGVASSGGASYATSGRSRSSTECFLRPVSSEVDLLKVMNLRKRVSIASREDLGNACKQRQWKLIPGCEVVMMAALVESTESMVTQSRFEVGGKCAMGKRDWGRA